jgi:two-component system OmpR family response regulator
MTSPERILVVDDDPRICRLLERILTREGYRIQISGSAKEMRRLLQADTPSLIILDLMLPDEDGFSIVRELRNHSRIPVIMLTGKTDVVDKVIGLEMGADDYITKPFHERELIARVRSAIRRNGYGSNDGINSERTEACFEGWRLELNAHELTSPDGKNIPLTTNEFRLLSLFLDRANQVLSRDRILDGISGRDSSPFDRSVDVMVGKVRKKIEEDPKNPRIIKTIRGSGYKLTAQVTFH